MTYYDNVEYFGIDNNTKTDDEVILCKNPQGATFKEIYDNMNNETENYKGSKEFKSVGEFKMPNLTIDEKREYTELQNKPFKTAEGRAQIQKAIQTIKFSLDEKGGEIKSEAAIDVKITTSIEKPKKEEPRYFYVDNTFAIFLREKGKEMPYFAGRVQDITKFQ